MTKEEGKYEHFPVMLMKSNLRPTGRPEHASYNFTSCHVQARETGVSNQANLWLQ
jgi:hypothetical protein